MKSYADIKQCTQLSLFLPTESADMCYYIDDDTQKYADLPLLIPYREYEYKEYYIPCWSLAALLKVIPKRINDYNILRIDIGDNKFAIWYDEIGYGVNNDLPNIVAESAVDVCVEMILKLHEQKLL